MSGRVHATPDVTICFFPARFLMDSNRVSANKSPPWFPSNGSFMVYYILDKIYFKSYFPHSTVKYYIYQGRSQKGKSVYKAIYMK